jgi:hypothetical protein
VSLILGDRIGALTSSPCTLLPLHPVSSSASLTYSYMFRHAPPLPLIDTAGGLPGIGVYCNGTAGIKYQGALLSWVEGLLSVLVSVPVLCDYVNLRANSAVLCPTEQLSDLYLYLLTGGDGCRAKQNVATAGGGGGYYGGGGGYVLRITYLDQNACHVA